MDRGITDTLAAADLPSRVGPERCAPPCWCGSLAPEGSTGQMVHSPHPPRHRTRPRCSHHHHHRRSIPKYCCCCCWVGWNCWSWRRQRGGRCCRTRPRGSGSVRLPMTPSAGRSEPPRASKTEGTRCCSPPAAAPPRPPDRSRRSHHRGTAAAAAVVSTAGHHHDLPHLGLQAGTAAPAGGQGGGCQPRGLRHHAAARDRRMP